VCAVQEKVSRRLVREHRFFCCFVRSRQCINCPPPSPPSVLPFFFFFFFFLLR
jgi:hypothetical protein